MSSPKETAAKVQDLLTLCLAKAFEMALVANKGPYWFSLFKEEEEKRRYPITRNYQKSISDCDFQALLKILYFRTDYAKMILHFFRRGDEISESSRQTPFQRTLGRLINDYRNNIAAHVSAKKIQDNISGNVESSFYDYPDAIRDMTSIAKVFEVIKDDKGRSYYKLIKKETKDKSKRRIVAGLVAGTIIVIAVVVCFIWKPWNIKNKYSMKQEPETVSVLDRKDTIVMNHDLAVRIVEAFFDRAKSKASSGDLAAFREMFDPKVYEEADISAFYQNITDQIDEYEYEFNVVTFTDTQIYALQFIYSSDGKVATTNSWVLSKTSRGWVNSSVNDDLKEFYNREMQKVFGDDYSLGYFAALDYQVVFQQPILPGIHMRLRRLFWNQEGDLIADVLVMNGTDSDLNSISMSNMTVIERATGAELVSFYADGFELNGTIKAHECRTMQLNVTQEENRNRANISPELKNQTFELTQGRILLDLYYE